MFRTCSVAVLAAMLVLTAGPAGASWTLIDDFDGYTAGTQIGSLAAWTTSGSNATSHTVLADPAGSGNLVLAATNASSNIYTTATIAQGNTGTLFFRMYIPSLAGDFAVGLTTMAVPTVADHHADSFRVENGALRVYHGTGFTTVASGISEGNWYSVWHVVDNQADKWQLYIEGPGFTGQQQLASSSTTDFNFRGGSGTNDLVNFFIRTNGNHTGQTAYIDDIYLFATATDLSFPLHLYWAPETGGTGNWSTTDATWSTSDQGTGAKQAWAATGPHKDAVFGGTAGTVTIDGAGITADNLRFIVDGYTVNGGTLTLSGTTPTITVASAASAVISANVGGAN
ncbi:MAG: hypothetical protein U1E05_17190, partial [Patescibacteria group bacterium]|nr:hypothetical protein [Patescibacteria group bacterium]